jgi:hypothetical protein
MEKITQWDTSWHVLVTNLYWEDEKSTSGVRRIAKFTEYLTRKHHGKRTLICEIKMKNVLLHLRHILISVYLCFTVKCVLKKFQGKIAGQFAQHNTFCAGTSRGPCFNELQTTFQFSGHESFRILIGWPIYRRFNRSMISFYDYTGHNFDTRLKQTMANFTMPVDWLWTTDESSEVLRKTKQNVCRTHMAPDKCVNVQKTIFACRLIFK